MRATALVVGSLVFFCTGCSSAYAETAAPTHSEIGTAINALGLDLYREQIKSAKGTSVLLSPYSLSKALSMTCSGAEGVTRDEMEKVLHLPPDYGAKFQDLSRQLADSIQASAIEAARLRTYGGNAAPIEFNEANRIFIQHGVDLRTTFTEELKLCFGATPARLDFRKQSEARHRINQWVASQTQNRIRDLLPPTRPTPDTTLALVNALHLKAGWQHEFNKANTHPESFHLAEANPVSVPTMRIQRAFGYAKRDGFTAVTIPYVGGTLQFLILVPDTPAGLAALEKTMTPHLLTDCAQLESRQIDLYLPKFKMAPPTLSLRAPLVLLGMRTAFDEPRGSANFDRMAPRKPNDYLYVSDVFHKTWLALDEQGTEAAAATAVLMVRAVGIPSAPIEVSADRPFMFAVQHVASGACLFLGRVTDPR